ncbi:hypothetical protein T492DRAFT_1028772 [Pavlovales sp. CCMP2436]|nr:hypothetical protein T492DRAFT_1028772 [Pavlovales sp. CCMP2436]
MAWLAGLIIVLAAPSLTDIGISLGTRGYRIGQVDKLEVLASAAVINRNFFASSREGPHKVEFIANALRARMGTRFETGGIEPNERSSLVLGVASESTHHLIAVAELSMQPRNGQVPGNFRPTYFPGDEPMVPYMCNIAVDSEHRHRGIARAMMDVSHEIALSVWCCSEVFLHVDARNSAAAGLYTSLGYEALPHWDVPAWKEKNLGLVPFRYHRKVLSLDPSYVPYSDECDRRAQEDMALGRAAPTLGFVVQ